MGDRIVRIDWNGPGSARVLVQNFPMSAMPEEVRGKFTDRLAQELRAASGANQPGGEVKLEIADANAGSVMATVTPTGPAPAAPAADSGPRSPFQQDVEKRLRGAPIMGDRIVRIDWNGPGSARVLVQNFPMSAMPEEVRGKFTDRLAQELRAASGANQPGGEVKLEIADAGAGTGDGDRDAVRAQPRSARPAPLRLVGRHLLRRGVLDLLGLRDLEVGGVLHHRVVERGVVLEDVGDGDLLEDRLPGALGLAGAAVDALVGMDVELVRPLLAIATRCTRRCSRPGRPPRSRCRRSLGRVW